MKPSTTLPRFFCSPHEAAGMNECEPVLVALSGGADSVTLIHLIKKYSALSGCRVFAAHVNHGIRTVAYGNEADRDERFCRDLCEKLDIELFVKKLNIPELSRASGKSLETEARDARYAFFSEIMERKDIKVLCTAHNADDNLETMLFNMARGCALEGMCGIPTLRALGKGVAVRPILSATKREILAYCEEHELSFMTDSTNLEDDCTRNKIRHTIIPELEALFGSPQRSARRLSSLLREENELLNGIAQEHLRMCRTKNGDNKNTSGFSLSLDEFDTLHVALKRRVLNIAFKDAFGCGLESVHIDALCEMIKSRRTTALCALPSEKYAFISEGDLIFSSTRPSKSSPEQIKLPLGDGTVFLPEKFAVTVGLDDKTPDGYELYAKARIKQTEGLYIRYRAEGDKILDGGMHKRLKKLMCDKGIPEEYRKILPIICRGDEIIYIPRCAVCDSVKEKCGQMTVTVYIKTNKYKENNHV